MQLARQSVNNWDWNDVVKKRTGTAFRSHPIPENDSMTRFDFIIIIIRYFLYSMGILEKKYETYYGPGRRPLADLLYYMPIR